METGSMRSDCAASSLATAAIGKLAECHSRARTDATHVVASSRRPHRIGPPPQHRKLRWLIRDIAKDDWDSDIGVKEISDIDCHFAIIATSAGSPVEIRVHAIATMPVRRGSPAQYSQIEEELQEKISALAGIRVARGEILVLLMSSTGRTPPISTGDIPLASCPTKGHV